MAIQSDISVIIPVHNGRSFIAEAIQSVANQTYAPLEILVVDDGSIDDSAVVAKNTSPLVRVLSQPQQGAAMARNHGIRESRGRLLAFLDADDLWMESKLELQVKMLEDDHKLDGVFSMIDHFISPEWIDDPNNKILCPAKPMAAPIATTFCIKKTSFLKVGFFKAGWRVGEFVDWYAQAMDHSLLFSMLPMSLAKRRLHQNNMSSKDISSRVDFARIVKASLDRRREKGVL